MRQPHMLRQRPMGLVGDDEEFHAPERVELHEASGFEEELLAIMCSFRKPRRGVVWE
jgi:hypothetical protein